MSWKPSSIDSWICGQAVKRQELRRGAVVCGVELFRYRVELPEGDDLLVLGSPSWGADLAQLLSPPQKLVAVLSEPRSLPCSLSRSSEVDPSLI